MADSQANRTICLRSHCLQSRNPIHLWRFSGKKRKEDLPFIIAFETDNADIESARESGEIGKDERIYSIDQHYKNDSEGVFTMYKSKPEYAEVKKIVTDAIGHSAEPAATLEEQ